MKMARYKCYWRIAYNLNRFLTSAGKTHFAESQLWGSTNYRLVPISSTKTSYYTDKLRIKMWNIISDYRLRPEIFIILNDVNSTHYWKWYTISRWRHLHISNMTIQMWSLELVNLNFDITQTAMKDIIVLKLLTSRDGYFYGVATF